MKIDLKRLNAGVKYIKHILETNKNIEQHLAKRNQKATQKNVKPQRSR